MSGPAPKKPDERRRRNVPAGGEWQPAPGSGWLHGDVPVPPDGLREAALETWGSWFSAWFSSFWSPDDLPMLRRLIRLYDECDRIEDGDWTEKVRPAPPYAELRQLGDRFGLSPAARQKLRWLPPDDETASASKPAKKASRYKHLKAVPADAVEST